jgi:glucose/arabinose dehydrogenase
MSSRSAFGGRAGACAWAWIAVLAAGACGTDTSDEPGHPPDEPACAGDNGGITLPPGFCATVFADQLGRARHLAVTASGDVLVAIAPRPGTSETGRVVALRDADRDGVAETVRTLLDVGGNGIAWRDGWLYLASNDRIVRFSLPDGSLVPERPRVLVSGLPIAGDHDAKTIVPASGAFYVNIGSGTNACQIENRVLHSPGIDPCPELRVRAGVWRYSLKEPDQPVGGLRYATGVRNANALALDRDGTLWAAVNGRDQLHEDWPELYTEELDLRLPAEEIVALREGEDRGWPYCYYDPFRGDMMLAPEYGGKGEEIGRCGDISNPALVLPAHWAPLGAVFYEGQQFPERYRGGMFVANHGSRFDMTNTTGDPGYNVVFIPFDRGAPAGSWEEFAAGFTAGLLPLPEAAPHRPVGVAVMPDGALLISDDQGGRIWKVTYSR